MSFVLENEYIYLECMEDGGQIKHLLDKEKNVELMYQGDQGWSGRNPSLFPLVGNTYTKDYQIDGKTYAMKNHGLVRYATCIGKKEEDALIFSFDSNDETLKQYPFEFHYEIQYRLEKKMVKIAYAIQNTGSRDMPFSFGLHPAFRIPQKDGETFESYSLVFEKKEHAQQLIFDETFEKKSKWVDTDIEAWQLNYEDIDTYKTMIFRGYESDSVTMKYKEEVRFKVHFKGYPFLAIWTHPKHSDFLCIEPWYGHADYNAEVINFYQREGTKILAPQEIFEPHYEIELCD